MPRELVVAHCTGVSEGDTPAMRGAEFPDGPAVFDCRLEKFDGILVGDGGAGGVT